MMEATRYLIVGGGLTGDAACRGVRDLDPDGSIVLVGDEAHPPYARPPLSKALWKGAGESTIWCGTRELGVELRLGRRITTLDLEQRQAFDSEGDGYKYEKLLFATGGRPRRLAFGGDAIIYFRTLDDYRRLRNLADQGGRFAVVGGGFIGSEIAAALAMSGAQVTMVFPDPGIGARVFPAGLSTALNDEYRGHGVEVLDGVSVTGIEEKGASTRLLLGGGQVLEADTIVAGIGIEPNTELAVDAGLPVADGIVVDRFGEVAGRSDVFAAGDVARFPVAALGRDLRVEHEDHARSHGRCVGANMAGAAVPYDHLPFFYSDLFDLGYEAVGEIDSRLDMLVELAGVGDEGAVSYLGEGRRRRGVLLWNMFGRVDQARDLIRSHDPVTSRAFDRQPA